MPGRTLVCSLLALSACEGATPTPADEAEGSSGASAPMSSTSGDDAAGEVSTSASGSAADTTSGAGSSSSSTGEPQGSSDAGEAPTRSLFVATGSVGRTIISADDGWTWTEDRSDDPDVVCAANNAGPNPNCFEGTFTARGIAFEGGAFFTTYDWAREPERSNTVRRSTDGVSWTVVNDPGGFGGIAAGNGTVVLAGPSGTDYVLYSDDLGESWTQVDSGYGTWANVRQAKFVPGAEGVFILGGDGNGFDDGPKVITSLDGATWRVPEAMPTACPSGFRLSGGFGSVGDRLVLVGPDGSACHSDDAGLTWATSDAIGESVRSHDLVQTAAGLELWTRDAKVTTADGVIWSFETLSGDDVSVGPVARDPDTGTYVAVTSGYLNGYADQHFYRSPDGIEWTQLAAEDTVQSHPLLAIQHGRVED